MSTKIKLDTRATSAEFGKTTDHVKVKMPDKVIVHQLEKQLNSSYSEERQCSVSIADLPSYTVGVDITSLRPGSNDRKHRHYYETLIYILEGSGYSVIEGENVEWEAGDALYIPPWSWHQHLIQALIKRYDTSPAQTHHYCKVLEILIAGKKLDNS